MSTLVNSQATTLQNHRTDAVEVVRASSQFRQGGKICMLIHSLTLTSHNKNVFEIERHLTGLLLLIASITQKDCQPEVNRLEFW